MSPVTHFLTGWALANTAALNRRDRSLVTLAAVVPDVDGLGVIPEVLTRHSSQPLLWFTEYHHSLHTLCFALIFAAITLAISRRWFTAGFALIAFHVHLLEDLEGARGPDGYAWPIPYLSPFSRRWQWAWSGQWALNAWPNMAITVALLGVMFYIAWKSGRSPLEMVSEKADRAFVETVRARVPVAVD